jgi:outer membrane protein TolC
VDVAVAYYQVLQQRDRLAIEQQSLRNFEQTFKLVKAQVDGGMLSRVQADQAEQNVLAAQSRVEGARQTYEDRLDGFKLTLGIPIAANIELDQAELAKLTPLAIPFDLPTSERTALRTRPDVLTSHAALRDRKRDVEMAADAFNPQLDVMLAVSVIGRQPRQPFKLQTHHPTYTAGLDFSYPLDQVDNRDAYRNALIAEQRARRDLDEFLDTVRREVRSSYRSLLASKRNYEIQTAAVKLAVRRLKLVRVEQKEGLASTRDVLEAEDDWRNSRNAVTGALVNYVTTRLRFLATLGMVSVDEQGRYNERREPEYIDRFRGDAPPAR